jgi:hypothetical protein
MATTPPPVPISAFITSVVINSVVAAVFLGLFFLLRLRYPAFFAPRLATLQVGVKGVPFANAWSQGQRTLQGRVVTLCPPRGVHVEASTPLQRTECGTAGEGACLPLRAWACARGGSKGDLRFVQMLPTAACPGAVAPQLLRVVSPLVPPFLCTCSARRVWPLLKARALAPRVRTAVSSLPPPLSVWPTQVGAKVGDALPKNPVALVRLLLSFDRDDLVRNAGTDAYLFCRALAMGAKLFALLT